MSYVALVGTAVSRENSVGTLYRSTSADDWNPVAGIPLDTGVQAITPHPNREGEVFAATCSGVYKSKDGGLRWTKLQLPDSEGEEFWSLSVHPQRPNTLFAGSSPVGVYRSDDSGETWQFCGEPKGYAERIDGLPWRTARSRVMRIVFDARSPDLMFGAVEINGFIVSEDGGKTWRDASDQLIKLADQPKLKNHIVSSHDYEGMIDGHAVCTSPAAPGSVIYACRTGLFATEDLGKTWRSLNVGNFAPIDYGRDVWIAVDDPSTIYTALSLHSRAEGESVGAIYRSSNLGQTWERVDKGVSPKSTVMGMRVHVTDPGKLIDVTRGGQVFWTVDHCRSWNESQLPATAGDAYCAAIL
jgi:photosystem II stability/assembly factor-like uncharacterized protein